MRNTIPTRKQTLLQGYSDIMAKSEYHKGLKARENFERTMTALFRVKKSDLKEKSKPERKRDKPGKD